MTTPISSIYIFDVVWKTHRHLIIFSGMFTIINNIIQKIVPGKDTSTFDASPSILIAPGR